MKKRSFLLIEVLIAMTLVTLCIVPLIRQPLKLYTEELGQLEEMEKQRLADWTFTEVKEFLLKNELPWEEIPERYVESSTYPLKAAHLTIPGCTPKTIKRSFFLKGEGEKTGLHGETYKIVGVYILLNEDRYRFRVTTQKLSISNNNLNPA